VKIARQRGDKAPKYCGIITKITLDVSLPRRKSSVAEMRDGEKEKEIRIRVHKIAN
jgi:hypothetical protein